VNTATALVLLEGQNCRNTWNTGADSYANSKVYVIAEKVLRCPAGSDMFDTTSIIGENVYKIAKVRNLTSH
jgi:hypothetical protein